MLCDGQSAPPFPSNSQSAAVFESCRRGNDADLPKPKRFHRGFLGSIGDFSGIYYFLYCSKIREGGSEGRPGSGGGVTTHEGNGVGVYCTCGGVGGPAVPYGVDLGAPIGSRVWGGGRWGGSPLCPLGIWGPVWGKLGVFHGEFGVPDSPYFGVPYGEEGSGSPMVVGGRRPPPPPPLFPPGTTPEGDLWGGPVVPYGVFPQSQWVGGVGELGYLTGGAWGRPLFTMGVVGPPSATEGVWGSPVVLWGEGGDLESLTSLCFIGGSWGSYGIFGVPLWGSWGLPKGVFGPPPQGG